MRSTGEVMGLDRDFAHAFAKSQLGSGTKVPKGGTVFVSMRDADKARILPAIELLKSKGFDVVATGGTQRYLAEHGVEVRRINKVLEGRPHIVDSIKNGEIALVFNTTDGAGAMSDSRRCAAPPFFLKSPTTRRSPARSPRPRGSRPCRRTPGGHTPPGLRGEKADRGLILANVRRAGGRHARTVTSFVPGDGMMDKVPITATGFVALQKELRRLTAEERPRIIEAISEARSHGDLSENAEYHAAKEAQGMNEAKIADLEDKLGRAEVIDVSKLSGDTIKFGATATVFDEDTEEEKKFMIVGEIEAEPRRGKLSIGSPMARALIGKRVGDVVEVNTPGGSKSYEILKIQFVDGH